MWNKRTVEPEDPATRPLEARLSYGRGDGRLCDQLLVGWSGEILDLSVEFGAAGHGAQAVA